MRPRFFIKTVDRSEFTQATAGVGIPLKERVVDNYDPVVWLLRKFRGQKKASA